jgi:hypothetical protein
LGLEWDRCTVVEVGSLGYVVYELDLKRWVV